MTMITKKTQPSGICGRGFDFERLPEEVNCRVAFATPIISKALIAIEFLCRNSCRFDTGILDHIHISHGRKIFEISYKNYLQILKIIYIDNNEKKIFEKIIKNHFLNV